MHELFQKRHSTRSFQKRDIAPEVLQEILDAANSAPSAGNLKAREVVVAKDKETIEKLAKASYQDWIGEASVVLVFFSVPLRSAQKYGERGRKLYALQDATIATSFAWLQAVSLGIAGCWVGAFNENEIKETLRITEDWQPIALLPLGYPAQD